MAERAADAAPPNVPPQTPGRAAADTAELRHRLDRFGDLFSRGLDLAEAGLSLGLTIATTLGSVAQQKVTSRGSPEAPPRPAPEPVADAAGPGFGLANRLPLFPGGEVHLSFSINNESTDTARPVSLVVQGFAGEAPGASLPLGALAVTPERIVIAPLDFEKFVLRGRIPPDVTPCVYRGTVIVDAEAGMSIPVTLRVSTPDA